MRKNLSASTTTQSVRNSNIHSTGVVEHVVEVKMRRMSSLCDFHAWSISGEADEGGDGALSAGFPVRYLLYVLNVSILYVLLYVKESVRQAIQLGSSNYA
jgi:hypothetical protein